MLTQPKLVAEVWPCCCLRRMRGGANLFLLFCCGVKGSVQCLLRSGFFRYFCVEAFLITTCINIRGSPHFLLSLQWDTGSHSPAWGFILSEAWIPRSSPKPICKYLPFLSQQHKDGSESTSYIVPESSAYVLLLSASRLNRKLGWFGFIFCQTKWAIKSIYFVPFALVCILELKKNKKKKHNLHYIHTFSP